MSPASGPGPYFKRDLPGANTPPRAGDPNPSELDSPRPGSEGPGHSPAAGDPIPAAGGHHHPLAPALPDAHTINSIRMRAGSVHHYLCQIERGTPEQRQHAIVIVRQETRALIDLLWQLPGA